MSRLLKAATLFVGSLSLAGCLDLGQASTDPEPMCEVTADCAGASQGAICDEGICWGDPPVGEFSLIVSPPDDRLDVTTTEITNLIIQPDGWIVGLEYDPGTVVSGRLGMLCAEGDDQCEVGAAVAARLTFERPSRITGGPMFRRSVDTQANPEAGGAHFSVRLPTLETNEVYSVTITPLVPDDEAEPLQLDATGLAPPTRFVLDRESAANDLLWFVGGGSTYKSIDVTVDYPPIAPPDWEVFARGRWTAGDTQVRLSTTAREPIAVDALAGRSTYRIRLPVAAEDDFEIVVRAADTPSEPILRKSATIADPPEPINESVATVGMVRPSAPSAATYQIHVMGLDFGGNEVDVSGAQIRLTSTVSDSDTVATHVAEAIADSQGRAEVTLLPGTQSQNRLYLARVIPPADSEHATLFDTEIALGPGTGGPAALPGLVLSRRIPISGIVTNADGEPVAGVSIQLSPSVEFRAFLEDLDPATLQAINEAGLPTAISAGDGSYLVRVDQQLANRPASYDMEVVPPTEANAPRSSIESVSTAGASETQVVEKPIELSRAAYARGFLTLDGEHIAGGEVRLYQRDDNPLACERQGQGCVPPALLRWIARADESGRITLILPR